MPIADSIPALPADAAIFLDFDGTLVEITSRPDHVALPPRLQDMLRRLTVRCGGALALVSGRRIAELDRFLKPLRLPAAGVHGLERRRADGRRVRRATPRWMAAVLPELDTFAHAHPGVLVEKKRLSVAVHYRGAPAARPAVDALVDRVAGELGRRVRAEHGKMVAELRPAGHDKGSAIAAFMTEAPFHGRRPVCLGDDLTDEAGFAVANRMGGLSIHVGHRTDTAATWTLPDVTAVHAWLERSLTDPGT
jgi:trehalose 6-phosphate phosphatase